MTESSRGPKLVPRARVRWDAVRGQHALLAPELVLHLTGSAAETLALCDGSRTRADVIAALSARYPGAPIARDVDALLARLADRHLLDERDSPSPERANPQSPVPSPRAPSSEPDAPIALLAELTYRCPLRCGYCSNPTDLARHRDELDAATWQRVFAEAAALGVLQLHLSGGEPLQRPDLAELLATARSLGLYTNLITSAYGLDDPRLDALAAAGIDHVQISLQDSEAPSADAIAGTEIHAEKLRAARAVRARGIALSINVVLHRGNLARIGEIIDLAASVGAERIELANTQYHGWALRNRDALIPTREALEAAATIATQKRETLRGRMSILYVLPDYYTDLPKPCMDGWGRRFITVTPTGVALPCPGAHALPLAFDNVRDSSLASIWRDGAAFAAYRGNAWMVEPCASCDRRDVDHGGCRCQSFALTGDARQADPACAKSPHHTVVSTAREASGAPAPAVLYRVRTGKGVGP